MNITINKFNLNLSSGDPPENLLNLHLKNGGIIHIKKLNKGKFTDYCGGKVTNLCIQKAKDSNNSLLRKRAIFAENARTKFKHLNGGILHSQDNTFSAFFDNNIIHNNFTKYDSGGSLPEPTKNNIYSDYQAIVGDADVLEWKTEDPFDYINYLKNTEHTSNPIEYLLLELVIKNDNPITLLTISNPISPINTVKSTNNTQLDNSRKNIIKQINSFFTQKGLSKMAISGIIGNILHESGLNTKAINKEEKDKGINNYGRGLIQWSNDRVKLFEKTMGIPITKATLTQQLQFMWKEMQERPTYLNYLMQASSPLQAADFTYRGLTNGSTYHLASPELMQKTYSKSWSNIKSIKKKYNFSDELNLRSKAANDIYNYLLTI